MSRPHLKTLVAAALLCACTARAAGTLRFALDFDLDTLDPARSGSYIERAVSTSLCDALIGLDPALTLVPQLATAWEWSEDHLALTLHLREGVLFQDGAAMDAEAVRANLERYRTAPYSLRRGELKPILGEDVVDAHTLRIRLSEPYPRCCRCWPAGCCRHGRWTAARTRSTPTRSAPGRSASSSGSRRTT